MKHLKGLTTIISHEHMYNLTVTCPRKSYVINKTLQIFARIA